MEAVKATGLTKVYENSSETIRALKGVDFSVKAGEFVTIMGPSGAGKTTLLNLIGCLDNVTSGELHLFGKELATIADRKLHKLRGATVGFVFQEFHILPTLNATENVALPSVFSKELSTKEAELRAISLLEKLNMGHRLKHFPSELSGGEMQRVAVARSLMNGPKVILADEPTGNLDTKNAKNIFELMAEIAHSEGVAVILATHNKHLAEIADRTLLLKNGEIVGEEVNR